MAGSGVGFAGVLAIRAGGSRRGARSLAALRSLLRGGTVIICATLGQTERRVSCGSGHPHLAGGQRRVLMLGDFRWPVAADFPHLAMSGVFAAWTQLLPHPRHPRCAANQVAPAQYSQMVWALLIGAAIFSAVPRLPAVIGIG